MANHKSAKKRIRTSERRKMINKSAESKIKTQIKKAFAATEPAEAEKSYKEAVAVLDRETTSGIIHRNTAARKKSALTKHFNSLKAKSESK